MGAVLCAATAVLARLSTAADLPNAFTDDFLLFFTLQTGRLQLLSLQHK
jgi:hypothetical protein